MYVYIYVSYVFCACFADENEDLVVAPLKDKAHSALAKLTNDELRHLHSIAMKVSQEELHDLSELVKKWPLHVLKSCSVNVRRLNEN